MPTVKIYGPSNPHSGSVELSSGEFVKVDNPLLVDLLTLGDALDAYVDWFRMHIDHEWRKGSFTKCDAKDGEQAKYFNFDPGNGQVGLVDVHIMRDDNEICPKQDLDYLLFEGDQVHIGHLVC